MEAAIPASMLFPIHKESRLQMAESTVARDTAEQIAKGNLLYEEQQRNTRRFRIIVAISWAVLLLVILFLFSGQSFLGIDTIQLDNEFIRKSIAYIAWGIPSCSLKK